MQFVLQLIDLLTLAADDHARPGRVQDDLHFVARALDLDLRDAGKLVFLRHVLADLVIFHQQAPQYSFLEAYQRLFQPIMMPVRKLTGLIF